MKRFKLQKLITTFTPAQIPIIQRDPIVLLAGRSNVGKSSLINALFNQKHLAKTSSKPGKTRSLNFYFTEQGLVLVDMPGYGYARGKDSIKDEWQELMHAMLSKYAKRASIFLLLDARRGFMESDQQSLDYFTSWGIPYTLLITKCDKLTRSEQAILKRDLAVSNEGNFLLVSITMQETIEQLYDKLIQAK